MKTALCFTPDLAFFRPAVLTAASLIAQGDGDAFDIFIVCERDDVPPDFDLVDPMLRARLNLLICDFSRFDSGLSERGRFTRAVFRRLFLDRVLPETYARYIAMDADMLVVRPGLSRLAELSLGGYPIAAAFDMIYLMDKKRGALARQFQSYRQSLGLDLTTRYFNAGLMVVDRAAWRAGEFGERAARALRLAPEKYPFMEQSALNSLIAGRFAPLSPRYNFMGDFLLLELEERMAPIVMHFVNSPKPWHFDRWRGETRFARDYQAGFAKLPWPDWPVAADLVSRPPLKPRLTPARWRFAERLTEFLDGVDFIDL